MSLRTESNTESKAELKAETQSKASHSHYELVAAPKPKPSADHIKKMLAQYYGELSFDFDEFNSKVSFGRYLDAINNKIAAELSEQKTVHKVLSIGSGSGQRELAIRQSSRLAFDITCLDTSPQMCALADRAGLNAICGALPDLTFAENSFDACFFLNAFEVLTSNAERLQYLKLINHCLKPGGLFFIDAMDIENRNDIWAGRVKEQYERENLGQAGYDRGDCFCRRADQEHAARGGSSAGCGCRSGDRGG